MEYLNSKEVADILGVNVSTIKRWTDEGKLECNRTAGGHRKFQLHHVSGFLETHESHRNQANALLLEKDITSEIGMEIVTGNFEGLVDYLLERAVACDHQKVSQLLNFLYVQQRPLYKVFDKLISPVLRKVGELWMEGRLTVTEEHFASNTIYDALVRLQSVMVVPKPSETSAMLLNMSTELHVIPLKMVQILLEQRGFKVLTSGQLTPSDTLGFVVSQLKPDRIYVSSTYITDIQEVQDEFDTICEIAEQNDVTLCLGGEGFNLLQLKYSREVVRLKSFEDAYYK